LNFAIAIGPAADKVYVPFKKWDARFFTASRWSGLTVGYDESAYASS